MIGAYLVSETVIDRAAFMQVSKSITGDNHITEVDRHPGMSRLSDDQQIIKHFSGIDQELSTSVTHLGFIVAGLSEDVEQFIAYTRGMTHIDTSYVQKRGVRAILITGTVHQWLLACDNEGFENVYNTLVQKGFSRLFDGQKRLK